MKRLADLLFIWGWLALAAGFVLFYLVCEALGWRAFTCALSGTLPLGPAGPSLELAMLGLVYVIAYLGATLLAPVLALAAGIQWIGQHFLRRPARDVPGADKREETNEPAAS